MPEVTEQILDKLDTLTRLVALSLVSEKRQRDQIIILSKAGLQPKVIAEMIGTTRNTVSVELAKLRKEGRMRVSRKREAQHEEQE